MGKQDYTVEDFKKFTESIGDEYISTNKRHLAQIFLASRCDHPVLILGDTGTGKEEVAKLIHKHGLRAGKRLISVNCALIPKEHLYAELFGVQGGSFSGVPKTRHGLFKEADKGTIFLDEIGDLPLDAQAGLLRILETGEIRRLGQEDRDTGGQKVDVRIICATNRLITADDSFRRDLYYRLKVVPVHLDSLSKRQREIPYLLSKYLIPEGIENVDFHFYAFCITNKWGGNVRELKNFCLHSSLSHIDKTVFLFNAVNEFYKGGEVAEFDDPEYYSWKCPYSVEYIDDPNYGFHYDINYRIPKPVEVIDYLEYLRFVQEEGFGHTITASPIHRIRKTRYDTEYKGKKRKVIEYIYPLIKLQLIPKFTYQDQLGRITFDETEEFKYLKQFTNQILGVFWDFRRYKNRVAESTDYPSTEFIDNHKEAIQRFEKKYYQTLFKKYPNLSNHAIAKKNGQNSKTIKSKRKLYFLE